jgi:hypothetical protein
MNLTADLKKKTGHILTKHSTMSPGRSTKFEVEFCAEKLD